MLIENIHDFIILAKEKGICKNENTIIQDDYEFIQKEVGLLIKQNIHYSIFTAIDCEGKDICIINGLWRINRLGYVIIKLSNITIPDDGLIY